MKAAVRPIGDARDMAVLYRIEMGVVDMTLKIGVVSDCMLPITVLPDALLSFTYLACGARTRIEAS